MSPFMAEGMDKGPSIMDQTLDFIFKARRDENERKRINDCLGCGVKCELTVDRHRLCFDPEKRIVAIKRASDDDLAMI